MAVEDFILKQCAKCKAIKLVAEFGKQAHRKDGYRPWCKQCTNAGIYTKRKENWVAFLEKERERYANSIEKQVARRTRYRENNIDKIRAASNSYRHRNIEKANAKSRLWAKENAERHRAHQAKRRAVVLRASPVWANSEKVHQIYKNARNLELKDGLKRHVDHIVPLKHVLVCVLHNEFNLQILNEIENRVKGNRYWPDMP